MLINPYRWFHLYKIGKSAFIFFTPQSLYLKDESYTMKDERKLFDTKKICEY